MWTMPRPRKKPDYDAGKLMEQLIQEKSEFLKTPKRE